MRTRLPIACLLCALVTTACSDDEPSPATGPTSSASGAGAGGNGSGAAGPSGPTGTVGSGGGRNGGAGGGGGGTGLPVRLPPGWYEGPPTLNNDADCEAPTVIYPLEGEAGHLYAVRLVPDAYPFTVTGLHYELIGQSYCDITADHHVEVFVSASNNAAPPNEPDLLASIPVAGVPDGDHRVVELTLDEEIVLQDGASLFVAVELPLVEQSCIAACQQAPVDDRDYWSNAAVMPYDWATLGSFGFHDHARIGAVGSVTAPP